jgi:hypothetical protein
MITLDSVTPDRQPKIQHTPRRIHGYDGNGAPVYSNQRELTIALDWLDAEAWAEWAQFADGAAHTIEMPSLLGVQTVYAGCIVIIESLEQDAGHFNARIRISKIWDPV